MIKDYFVVSVGPRSILLSHHQCHINIKRAPYVCSQIMKLSFVNSFCTLAALRALKWFFVCNLKLLTSMFAQEAWGVLWTIFLLALIYDAAFCPLILRHLKEGIFQLLAPLTGFFSSLTPSRSRKLFRKCTVSNSCILLLMKLWWTPVGWASRSTKCHLFRDTKFEFPHFI